MAASDTTRRVGRPSLVDRSMIVDAAVAVGFDHLSMSAVGEHLGVSHATLYSYVKDRDGLVAAAVDVLFAKEEWPQLEGHWRDYLSSVCLQLWRLLDRHRGLVYALESGTRAPRPDGYATFLHDTRASLIDSGFEPLDAITIVSVVMDQALAFHRGGKDEAGSSLTVLEARQFLGHGEGPRLRGVDQQTEGAISDLMAMSPLEWFRRRLDLVLDAAETRHPGHAG